MKYIYFGMIIIFVVLQFSFWASAETRQKLEVVRFKHSMESAAYSACRAIRYEDGESLTEVGNGFGENQASPLNVPIDQEQGLVYFNEMFLNNLSVTDSLKKEELQKSVVLKVWVGFDGFQIKCGTESWKEKEDYRLYIGGESYKLNFSDYLIRSRDNKAVHWSDIGGMSQETIQNKINSIISTRVNDALLQSSVVHSATEKRYLTFLSDITGRNNSLTAFNGPGFLAILDGVKIPGMNIPGRNSLNLYSIGGSDLYRE